MCTLDKISNLLKEQGKTQKSLCEYLGIKQQAYTNWKNGNNDSYIKYLPKISEYFGVSVDYLLGKETQNIDNNNEINPLDNIPPHLVEIINLCKQMDDKTLKKALNWLQLLILQEKQE